MFSKACEYGLKAMISISAKSSRGERTNLKEIAGDIDSPEQFTAKVLQQLSRNKLIHSVQGAYGGFEIPKDKLSKIRLIDIVRTIDGEKIFTGCGLGLEACDANRPCPIHHKFAEIRNNLAKVLNETSLEELATGVTGGLTFLHR
ncbi:MAG: Rrf2 family transcriptional regulator [Reichenbachiella sp.]|uniref:RrF2 family transcriptional regulator n=1 Tax=Reichenbachiella sp. TaxID=2184521 RepID=UPI003266ACA1